MEYIRNDNWDESLDVYEFTLYMIFENFHENSHYRNGHFQENLENHMKGEFVKIQEFTLVIIFVIFDKKWQFRLENESFEISQNSS